MHVGSSLESEISQGAPVSGIKGKVAKKGTRAPIRTGDGAAEPEPDPVRDGSGSGLSTAGTNVEKNDARRGRGVRAGLI